MKLKSNSFSIWLGNLFTKMGFGMRAKLITIFVLIKIVPLVVLATLAWYQFRNLGEAVHEHTGEMVDKALLSLAETGDIAINDAVKALDERATEEIERATTDVAHSLASFLYARDSDILLVASFPPEKKLYEAFLRTQLGKIVKQGQWALSSDGKTWRRVDEPPQKAKAESSSAENDHSFHYRRPDSFEYEDRPLYREITFVDLQGREQLKVVSNPAMDAGLKDVSQRANTFARAETYFEQLKNLKPGEIYVSNVIGEYVGSRVIDVYTPETAAKAGEEFAPEQSAYAGKENPLGKHFKGIVRWATPIVRDKRVIGYVTLALDHDHILEFTNHVMPTRDHYTEISDASEGNYAFIWDHKGRNIAHPRHFSIAGYDGKTGEPQVPWLEEEIYQRWQESKLSYVDFIQNEPTFVEQSNSKQPSLALKKQGLVGLDCRYLNFAPQCTGWFDLTRDGGSGSFLIRWSGLWKLTTAAAIPYYTGQYGASAQGFGFVAIGAGMSTFHLPAAETRRALNKHITATDEGLAKISTDARRAIEKNFFETSTALFMSTLAMGILVIFIAIWMASIFSDNITRLISGISRFRSGERDFRFHSQEKDELGALADSFDEMADSVVGSLKEPLIITNLELAVIYVNESALALLGVSKEEVVGKPYAKNSILTYASSYCPIVALERGTEPEVMFHKPSGCYYRGKASYLTNNQGRKIGYNVVITDVSRIIEEQKKNEQQRMLLGTVFSASPDLIWYEDDQGRYLAANPRFASLVGRDPLELQGVKVEETLPLDIRASFMAHNEQAIYGGGPLHTEECIPFADGHTETVDAVRMPLFNFRGDFVGLLGVARDVTQRVEAEVELRKTQLELEKAAQAANMASESKSAFLARMSHEIRTPMNAIIGMANITERKLQGGKASTGEVLSHIRQIELSSSHLLGLLNDILDISKIEAGRIELLEESFDLRKVGDDVAAIIRPRCQEKNILFNVELESFHKTQFISDPLRLRQVLINLLGNAVKFTPDYGVITFRIVQMERQEGQARVLFSVKDSGIGISSEVQQHLFKPFEQGGSHINKLYGGTGLGLSISKNIVNLMGGTIDVHSEEGQGSEFYFTLWLKEDSNFCGSDDLRGEAAFFPGRHALIVDDVAINRVIVLEQLARTGLIIDEADDGKTALEKFVISPEGYYDIILMDVQMPQMDGYEASKTIRGLERSDAGRVPIVAMTANAFKEDVERALAHGMNAHLAKPLESDKLIAVLHKYLGGSSETTQMPVPQNFKETVKNI